MRPDLINDEFMGQLKEAGCQRISLGVESGNDYIRNKVMGRQMSEERIIRAFKMAHKHGLETNAINIIGAPGETEEMLWDTIKLNRKVKPTSSGVNIFYPYKGTKLGDHCFEKNLVNKELYASFSAERKETVLDYPPEYRKRLTYYRENWEILIRPFSIKKRLKGALRKTRFFKPLRTLKRQLILRWGSL